MKTLIPAMAALVLTGPLAAVTVMAQSEAPLVDMTAIDADGSGALTFTELAAVMPEATEAMFAAADLDADGVLSAEEYAVLVSTLPG